MSLPRLIDGNNITTDDQHMWLIPFSYGELHTLNVTFNKAQTIAGLRIWNYNKSPEDSYRGVRHFSVAVSYETIRYDTSLHLTVQVYQQKHTNLIYIFDPGEADPCVRGRCCHLPIGGIPYQERTGQLSLRFCPGAPLHRLPPDAHRKQECRGLPQVGARKFHKHKLLFHEKV